MREKIGEFEVTVGNRSSLHVIVSQEINLDENKVVVDARKVFSLNDVGGEEISTTKYPDIFRRRDGSLLKKSGLIQAGNCMNVKNIGRSSYRR